MHLSLVRSPLLLFTEKEMAIATSRPVLLGVFFFLFSFCRAQMPGFESIDWGAPGGIKKYIDDLGLEWVPDKEGCNIRLFDTSLQTTESIAIHWMLKTRTHVVRASFLYGNFNNRNVYPKFDISLAATPWSTIVISDGDTIEFEELISVCLSNATSGQPFISTLQLRQLNGSLYHIIYETQFWRRQQ